MKSSQTAEVVEIEDLGSLDDLNSLDQAEMNVVIGGKPSNWTWIFAGPGHEKTVDYNAKRQREQLHEARQRENAQVNGRKYKAPEETVEQLREKNVNFVVSRLLGWSPIKFGGSEYPFSPDNARALLADPKKAAIYVQAIEFLADDTAFTKRSNEI